MIARDVQWLLVSLFMCNIINAISGLAADLPQKEEPVRKRSFCVAERVYRHSGYDCSNMNLRDVPQNLKTSVEVSRKDQHFFGFCHVIDYPYYQDSKRRGDPKSVERTELENNKSMK